MDSSQIAIDELSKHNLTHHPMELPHVGLGTMGIKNPDPVTTALEVGYRHLDTARIYDNESIVGDGIARSGVDRQEIVIATKLWTDSLSHEHVEPTTRESATSLGVDQLDLLYVHRPRGEYSPEETLPALDRLVERGITAHIGLSNFTIEELERAQEVLVHSIAAHQIELHPLMYKPELIEHARKHEYTVVGYSPLASGNVSEIDPVVRIAESNQTTPEAVAIAWATSKQPVVIIPKASHREHLQANLAASRLELDAQELAVIDSIERTHEFYPE